MILLPSPQHIALRNALAYSATEGHTRRLVDVFTSDETHKSDGYLAVLDHDLETSLFREPRVSLDDWLLNVDEWTKRVQRAGAAHEIGVQVLYHIWRSIADGLTRRLRQARIHSGIPQKGGVLLFLAGLSRCVVIEYDFISETPRLHVLSVIQDPKSAFDLWTAIDHADVMARNALKNFISTGHKLVAHRGVLVHVDRRNDIGVFGPSIDTLVMAEILAQQVFEAGNLYDIALEVGPGNGLISAALALHGKNHLKELFSIDMSSAAIACTIRNVNLNLSGTADSTQKYFVNGFFSPTLFNREFDLVVCNPPYIPLAPTMQAATSAVSDFSHAVGGLELADTLIRNSAKLLKPKGRMLIMASSLCLQDFLRAVPDRVAVTRPLGSDGFEVLFDVEAVFNRPYWLKYLVEERGLVFRDGAYYHTLHPIWLEAYDTLFADA